MEKAEHHEHKSPFKLTADTREPAKSKDQISVSFNEGWSGMRTGRAGRPIYCYDVTNVTKGHQYQAELFEDDRAEPYAWCDCAASVVCKHIKAALEDLLTRVPNFGEVLAWREEAATPLKEQEDNDMH